MQQNRVSRGQGRTPACGRALQVLREPEWTPGCTVMVLRAHTGHTEGVVALLTTPPGSQRTLMVFVSQQIQEGICGTI